MVVTAPFAFAGYALVCGFCSFGCHSPLTCVQTAAFLHLYLQFYYVSVAVAPGLYFTTVLPSLMVGLARNS